MKIIAKTATGYLCEVSSTEMREFGAEKNPDLDDEIPVTTAAHTLGMLRSLDMYRIDHAINEANDALTSLGKIKDNIDALLLFDKLAKEHTDA
jgi:hypothetical protein